LVAFEGSPLVARGIAYLVSWPGNASIDEERK